jgi:hypothetical protein
MSGFHLASIGFLRTSRLYGPPSRLWAEQARCCSFIRTILRIIRVNGSIIQQKRRALCMWCWRPCWEKPLCDNDCVVRQPGICREGKIFRKYEHQGMISLPLESTVCSMRHRPPRRQLDCTPKSQNRLCLPLQDSPPGCSQLPTSPQNGSARATDQHIRVACKEETLRLTDHAVVNVRCFCVGSSQ